MKALALIALAGCVSGLEPGEVGLGRRVGAFPGETPAMLPPMTDRSGNVYVVTGNPDSSGAPQPGTLLVGRPRGGWSDGCATGDGPGGGARGWIGATADRGWLWTEAALVEATADGDCRTILDRDPVSTSELTFLAVGSLVVETASGTLAAAIVTSGGSPEPALVAIDLDLGVIRRSEPLPGVTVLGAGADAANGRALFLVTDDAGARVLAVEPRQLSVDTVDISGDPGMLQGELLADATGAMAGVLADDSVLVGTREGLRVKAMPGAIGIEHAQDDTLRIVGVAGTMPFSATVDGTAHDWRLALEIEALIADGVVVIDERSGTRVATQWEGRHALGGVPLVTARSAPEYAVGTRAVLVADPPMDRGGIPYSQVAVVPVGIELP